MQKEQAINLQKWGIIFFAIAMLAFGGGHFIFGRFTTGRAPVWPADVPGRMIGIYAAGLIFALAGLAILIRRKVLPACIVTGIIIFFWAFLRNFLLSVHLPDPGLSWTNTGKALALFGGLCVVAAYDIQSGKGHSFFINGKREKTLFYTGRICLGLFLMLGGIQHFLFTSFVQTMVPQWIPFPYFWTYLAAIALILGGMGLMINKTLKPAALLVGTMIFIWFLILHIPMAIVAGYNANEWTAATEALAMSGIAFMLAAPDK